MFEFLTAAVCSFAKELVSGLIAFGVAMVMNHITSQF